MPDYPLLGPSLPGLIFMALYLPPRSAIREPTGDPASRKGGYCSDERYSHDVLHAGSLPFGGAWAWRLGASQDVIGWAVPGPYEADQ